MAIASRSSKRYLERSRLILTLRGPLPSHDTGANKAHREKLDPPLPIPEYQGVEQGDPPPDRGQTQEWPHGQIEG